MGAKAFFEPGGDGARVGVITAARTAHGEELNLLVLEEGRRLALGARGSRGQRGGQPGGDGDKAHVQPAAGVLRLAMTGSSPLARMSSRVL